MERINLKTLKVSHYDILSRIENRCHDRLAYHDASIWDLKQQISQHETQAQNEAEDLKACQDEMSQIDAECDAIIKAGSHFETVELIRFENGHEYYVVQYETGQTFSFGYVHSGTFHLSPDEFESQNEAAAAISKRELAVSQGETVMF